MALQYSSKYQQNFFVRGVRNIAALLKKRPMMVMDMDGCVLYGYNVRDGVSLPLNPGENPSQQDIPAGADIKSLLDEGKITPAIFAKKSLDVRLPPHLVHMLNRNIEHGERAFDLAFLTSRSAKDALYILRESGVKSPEKVTLVADSGASMYIDGKRQNTRTLTDSEAWFLQRIGRKPRMLQNMVKLVIRKMDYNTDYCPDIFIEPKGIATNIHWRAILNHFKQPEGSDLDKAIGKAFEELFSKHAEKYSFKPLPAPAAIEIKIAGVDKGKGLKALVKAAIEAGTRISHIIFGGDDINGTDRFAAAALPDIRKEHGIPADFIHVHHHPVDGHLDGQTPDPAKAIKDIPGYPIGKPALVVPTPEAMGNLIMQVFTNLHLGTDMKVIFNIPAHKL